MRPLLDDSQSASHRHARARRHRIRRRSLEPRPTLHPRAPARDDAVRSPAKGSMRAGLRSWRGGCGAPRPRSRQRSTSRRRRCRELPWPDRRADRASMPTNSIACPRRSPCACSAARLHAPATRDRSSSASSRHSTRRCGWKAPARQRAGAAPWRARWSPCAERKLAVERAPARRGRAASGAARAVQKRTWVGARRLNRGPQDGKMRTVNKELNRFPWQEPPRHLDCSGAGRESARKLRVSDRLRCPRQPRRTRDERQSAQFRPLGDHRSPAARAVHPVPEPGPAHHRPRTFPSRSS